MSDAYLCSSTPELSHPSIGLDPDALVLPITGMIEYLYILLCADTHHLTGFSLLYASLERQNNANDRDAGSA